MRRLGPANAITVGAAAVGWLHPRSAPVDPYGRRPLGYMGLAVLHGGVGFPHPGRLLRGASWAHRADRAWRIDCCRWYRHGRTWPASRPRASPRCWVWRWRPHCGGCTLMRGRAGRARAGTAESIAPPGWGCTGSATAFLPIPGGIIVFAAGVKNAVVQSGEPLTASTAWLLAAGVGTYLVGLASFRRLLTSALLARAWRSQVPCCPPR